MSVSMLILFIAGYLGIVLEHYIRINKAAIALITGVGCWTIYILGGGSVHGVNEQLADQLGELSGILFFLIGAMTIVELIDAHDGFDIISSRINTQSQKKLLWVIALLSFFLSAILDNLTTAIVMVSLVRKIVKDKAARLIFCGVIVIAANAGGAWSPIGDVTTTMLWIGGQITTAAVIQKLFLPGLASLIIPLLLLSGKVKGQRSSVSDLPETVPSHRSTASQREKYWVFFSGVSILLLVPLFKTVTHLPPYMGMLLGLGIIWVITEVIHSRKDSADKNFYSVQYAIRKTDTPSILFFLGILLSVAALTANGSMAALSDFLDHSIGSKTIIVVFMGLLSAVVDNVPLVAAAMGMYPLSHFPADDNFWHMVAYCAGTGGSILIIGSAAGVAAMGLDQIRFFDYFRKISWPAFLGYLFGFLVLWLLQQI